MHDRMNTIPTPLNALQTADLCPGSAALAGINASLR
jgi:2-oxoglutarate ferredoxin oxidoreductase subunit beta